MIEWLEYEDVRQKGGNDEAQWLALRKAKGKEQPEQPEPLSEVRRLRRFNFAHLKYSGGVYNQPRYWMMEIHTVIDAENEYQNMIAANLLMQQKIRDGTIKL